jgi:hypothetical protein
MKASRISNFHTHLLTPYYVRSDFKWWHISARVQRKAHPDLGVKVTARDATQSDILRFNRPCEAETVHAYIVAVPKTKMLEYPGV